MVMEWVMQHWWLALIALGLVWSVAAIVIDNREHARRTEALPPLDLMPRAATVTSMRIAPRQMIRFFTQNVRRETGDLWLIEVQYADAGGRTRTELLADLIHDDDLTRFPIGTTVQVYGFIQPQGRCLLTEAHDDVARRGYNLDGVRMRTDRQVWPSRTGSPLLGVMDDAERAVWIAEHGIPCEIYSSPFAHSNGEFSDTPGLILIDHRTTDAQSTRIVAAYRQWLRRSDTYQELQHGRLRSHGILASKEIFGREAKGGYFAEGGFDHDGWALLSPSQGTHATDEWWRSATLTPMLRDPAPPRKRSRR